LWKGGFGRGREGEVPIFNSSRDGKMLPRIFMRGDLGANGMKPFVSVRMIEMPMGIDQMLDRIVAETR
jgi:hypothetical protein